MIFQSVPTPQPTSAEMGRLVFFLPGELTDWRVRCRLSVSGTALIFHTYNSGVSKASTFWGPADDGIDWALEPHILGLDYAQQSTSPLYFVSSPNCLVYDRQLSSFYFLLLFFTML